MRILVSRNRYNSAALEKASLKQRCLLKTAQQSQFSKSRPMTDRNRQVNSRKCFGPRHDGAFLPGAFTRIIEVAEPSRGFPTPFGTNSF